MAPDELRPDAGIDSLLLRVSAACMFTGMRTRKGEKAEGGLREWANKLVGGGRLRREPGDDVKVEGRLTGKPFRPASLKGIDGERPICAWRLDLVAEQKVPPSSLVKLEPLKEP